MARSFAGHPLRLFLVGLIAVLSALSVIVGCGGGGGGNTDAFTTGATVALTGLVTREGATTSVRGSGAIRGSPVAGAEVYIQEDPLRRSTTDSEGRYRLLDLPVSLARFNVVASWTEGGTVWKNRTPVTNTGVSSELTGDVKVEQATARVEGRLLDANGNPLAEGTILTLWGEIFRVLTDGRFVSPPLPPSAATAEITFAGDAGQAPATMTAPLTTGDLPAIIEVQLVSRTAPPNAPPSALLTAKVSGQEVTKVAPKAQVSLALQVIDPDPNHATLATNVWTKTRGELAQTANVLTNTWTAPDLPGQATITVRVTDPLGAVATAQLRLVIEGALTATKEITAFRFPAGTLNSGLATDAVAIIGGTAIQLQVPNGVSRVGLIPEITHTGIDVVPRSGIGQDFSQPVTYKVTAADWSTKEFTVTVNEGPDTTAPAIVTLTPANGATTAALDANLVITFNEIIAKGTGNLVIRQASDGAILETIDVSATEVTVNGTQATINPAVTFSPSGTYYVELAPGAFKDLAGNLFTGISGATTWRFSTPAPADTTAPTIAALTPADDSATAAPDADLVIVFSENVLKGTGAITVRNDTDGTTLETIDVTSTRVTIRDAQVTIDLSQTLLPSKAFHVEIAATCFKDAVGNAFAGIADSTTWNFSTPAPADTTAPAVASFTPASGSVNVGVETNLAITFTENVLPGTGNLVIFDGPTGAVFETIAGNSGQVTIADRLVTVNPAAVFTFGRPYYVTIAAGFVQDAAGNAYPGYTATTTWSFTAAAAPDTTAPTLQSLSPADNATTVATDANLVLTFTESVTKKTGTIVIHDDTAGTVFENIDVTSGLVTVSGNLVTINPAGVFTAGRSYHVTVAATCFVDAANNAFAGITDATTWNFSVPVPPDTTAPAVASFSPVNGATNVAVGSDLVVTFNETVVKGTGNILIRNDTDGTTFETIDVAGGLVTVSGAQVTINPAGTLTASKTFHVEIAATCFKDAANNAFPGFTSAAVWSFATPAPTDTTPPTVSVLSPPDGATTVATDANLVLTFSENVVKGTGNLVIKNDSDGTIFETIDVTSGLVTVSGNQVTVNPAGTFAPSKNWHVEIAATCFKDAANNAFAGITDATTWNFSTPAPADTTAPTVTAFSPLDGATSVPAGTNLVITFSENVVKGTGNLVIRNDSDGTTFETIDVTAANVTVSANQVTIDPAGTLGSLKNYHVEIAATCFRDAAGNPFAGIANATTWNFSSRGEIDQAADLLITEVSTRFYSNVPLFIEVYNDTDGTLQLADYSLRCWSLPSGGGVPAPRTYTLPSLSIAPRTFALLVTNVTTNQFATSRSVLINPTADGYLPYWAGDGFVELVKAGQTTDFVRFGTNSTPPTTGTWGTNAPALESGTDGVYGKSLQRARSLADTDTGTDWTFRQYATPAGPNDVLSDTDLDLDGIPDSCEAPGQTYVGLPLYDWGARTNQKDLFIHVAHMDSTDPGVTPRKEALAKVAAAFAPHGFVLHFDAGTLYGSTPADYNLDNTSHRIPLSTKMTLSTVTGSANLYEVKAQSIDLAKRHVFYFCVFAYEEYYGAAGKGEVNGNDFLVALGNNGLKTTPGEDLTYLINQQASTLMHEFGHNLGLRHGGGEEVNYKPNYRSIMNYLYSNYGLPQIGNVREGDRYYHEKWYLAGFPRPGAFSQYFPSGTKDLHNNPWSASFTMDFSEGKGGTLNEASLNEPAGLLYPGSTGVDWNGDMVTTSTGLALDVNFSSNSIESYGDYNDWANLAIVFARKTAGVSNAPGGSEPRPYVFAIDDCQEVATETPRLLPHQMP
ncbi:MAG: hypothetical protein GX442_06470 [Candidatus Riflebacteria bacterium]|nr:hypothetical protein [Candidatus Riflebacteria bacterium]